MKNVFKIIELDDRQVLLKKNFDSEQETDVIEINFFTNDGIEITQKLGYNDENKRDEWFEKIGEEDVRGIVNSILEMMN